MSVCKCSMTLYGNCVRVCMYICKSVSVLVYVHMYVCVCLCMCVHVSVCKFL